VIDLRQLWWSVGQFLIWAEEAWIRDQMAQNARR